MCSCHRDHHQGSNGMRCQVDRLLETANPRQGCEKREMEAFGQVASQVVHDLRNLNNVLSLTARNFEDHVEDPTFRQEAVHTLQTTTRRMKDLIEKLFAGPTPTGPQRQVTTLGALVFHALDLLARAGNQAQVNATIIRGLDGPAHCCEVDIEEMERVVYNLLVNAYEAVEQGGEVSVTCLAVPESSQVRMVIEDTGPGFSESYLENCLFCAFRSTKPCGGGVGLYHARGAIAAHGGDIRIANREDATGARVTVTLPAATQMEKSDWHSKPVAADVAS